jgi:hypothetical protein
MDHYENSPVYNIMGLAICQLPYINWEPIDQFVDIDVLPKKSVPIDQSDQLTNGTTDPLLAYAYYLLPMHTNKP